MYANLTDEQRQKLDLMRSKSLHGTYTGPSKQAQSTPRVNTIPVTRTVRPTVTSTEPVQVTSSNDETVLSAYCKSLAVSAKQYLIDWYYSKDQPMKRQRTMSVSTSRPTFDPQTSPVQRTRRNSISTTTRVPQGNNLEQATYGSTLMKNIWNSFVDFSKSLTTRDQTKAYNTMRNAHGLMKEISENPRAKITKQCNRSQNRPRCIAPNFYGLSDFHSSQQVEDTDNMYKLLMYHLYDWYTLPQVESDVKHIFVQTSFSERAIKGMILDVYLSLFEQDPKYVQLVCNAPVYKLYLMILDEFKSMIDDHGLNRPTKYGGEYGLDIIHKVIRYTPYTKPSDFVPTDPYIFMFEFADKMKLGYLEALIHDGYIVYDVRRKLPRNPKRYLMPVPIHNKPGTLFETLKHGDSNTSGARDAVREAVGMNKLRGMLDPIHPDYCYRVHAKRGNRINKPKPDTDNCLLIKRNPKLLKRYRKRTTFLNIHVTGKEVWSKQYVGSRPNSHIQRELDNLFHLIPNTLAEFDLLPPHLRNTARRIMNLKQDYLNYDQWFRQCCTTRQEIDLNRIKYIMSQIATRKHTRMSIQSANTTQLPEQYHICKTTINTHTDDPIPYKNLIEVSMNTERENPNKSFDEITESLAQTHGYVAQYRKLVCTEIKGLIGKPYEDYILRVVDALKRQWRFCMKRKKNTRRVSTKYFNIKSWSNKLWTAKENQGKFFPRPKCQVVKPSFNYSYKPDIRSKSYIVPSNAIDQTDMHRIVFKYTGVTLKPNVRTIPNNILPRKQGRIHITPEGGYAYMIKTDTRKNISVQAIFPEIDQINAVAIYPQYTTQQQIDSIEHRLFSKRCMGMYEGKEAEYMRSNPIPYNLRRIFRPYTSKTMDDLVKTSSGILLMERDAKKIYQFLTSNIMGCGCCHNLVDRIAHNIKKCSDIAKYQQRLDNTWNYLRKCVNCGFYQCAETNIKSTYCIQCKGVARPGHTLHEEIYVSPYVDEHHLNPNMKSFEKELLRAPWRFKTVYTQVHVNTNKLIENGFRMEI